MKKKILIICIVFIFFYVLAGTDIYASKYLVRGKDFETAASSTDALDVNVINYIEGLGDSHVHNLQKLFKENFLDTNVYEVVEISDEQFESIVNKIGTTTTNLNGYTYVTPKIGKNELQELKNGNEVWYAIMNYDEARVMTKEEFFSNIEKVNNNQDFWGNASTWFGSSMQYETPNEIDIIIDTFFNMINVVGTTVIVIATIVLGIKYIIGTVESQTSAKEGLITLLIACVFFFGWTSIKGLLFPNNDFIFTSSSDASYKDMVGRIFSTFTYIAQFIVVAAIIYVGIKYIFAGASGRAELKGKSVYFIIGIILVFATTNVLSFISNIINDTL